MPHAVTSDAFIIFDGDDTLWLVEPLYERAREDVREMILRQDLDPAMWENFERSLDVDRFAQWGFSTDRFPGSCVLAYERIAKESNRRIDGHVSESIWRRAMQVFSDLAPLADGASQAVSDLAADHSLVLLTQGDAAVQKKRVVDSGLAHWFGEIEITPRKDEETFRALIKQLGRPPSSGWSIGNSMASDIEPALKCGLRGILVKSSSWEYETRSAPHTTGRWLSVHSLTEAVRELRG